MGNPSQRRTCMRDRDCLQRNHDILLLAQRIAALPRVHKKVLAMYYFEICR